MYTNLKGSAIFIILLAFISSSRADCGCNKANRNAEQQDAPINTEQQEAATTETTLDSKVCEKRGKNRHYRDYYPEPVIENMSLIPGGKILIGTDKPHFKEDGESPERLVEIKDFYMDRYEVSNKEFGKFVSATLYLTEAEKFGDSFLFKTLLTAEQQKEFEDFRVVNAPWWYKVKGVDWQHPHGTNSSIKS